MFDEDFFNIEENFLIFVLVIVKNIKKRYFLVLLFFFWSWVVMLSLYCILVFIIRIICFFIVMVSLEFSCGSKGYVIIFYYFKGRIMCFLFYF